MRTVWKRLNDRATSHGKDRGETPIAVMLGLVVLAILALAAGPALMSLTAQSAANSNDRRADKALAVLTDSARRAPWKSLTIGGPYTETVTLAGVPTTVATWVSADPASARRLLITKAVPEQMSGARCDQAKTPAALPKECIVRTATVASTATDIRPTSSPTVTLGKSSYAGTKAVAVPAKTNVFTVAVTEPLQVAVIARTDADATLHFVSTNIERAKIDLRTSASAGNWRFGNVIVCPSWSRGGKTTARLETPASVNISDLLVLTTPAPGACG